MDSEKENNLSPEVVEQSTWRKIARILVADNPQENLKKYASGYLTRLAKKTFLDTISVIITGQPLQGSWLGDMLSPGSGYYPYHNQTATASSISPVETPKADSKDPKFKGCVFFEENPNNGDPDWEPAKFRAERTLEELNAWLREYKKLSIFRLYDIAAISGMDYQSDNWGWTDLSDAKIYPSNGGWTLQLPKYKYLY